MNLFFLMPRNLIKGLKIFQDKFFNQNMSYEYSNDFDFDREFIKAKNKTTFLIQLCQLIGGILMIFGTIFTIIFLFIDFITNESEVLFTYNTITFIGLTISGTLILIIGSIATNSTRQTALLALQSWNNAPFD